MMRTTPPETADQEEQREDRLIALYIEPYPGRPNPAESRLKVDEGGVPVWALIGALAEDAGNIAAVARDYKVRRAAVEAAWAYYQRHREGIDARLADL